MKETSHRLGQLVEDGSAYLVQAPEAELSYKPTPTKWSKKEILGHLIDSGVHNLQRFTEIQFEPKPYLVRRYKQDELVQANHYQQADIQELVQCWQALNHRIMALMNSQTDETLGYEIELGNGEISDLRFLMVDYVNHLAHHVRQIMEARK